MPKLSTPLHVWLVGHGDEPLRVTSDQRDLARWEASDDYRPGRQHLVARFVAWSALVRNQRYGASWKQFNEHDCIEVESLYRPVDDAEEEQGLDPGVREMSATG